MEHPYKSTLVDPHVSPHTCFPATLTNPSSDHHLKYLSSVAGANKSSSSLATGSSLDLSVGPAPSPVEGLRGDSKPGSEDVHSPWSPRETAALNKVRGLFHPDTEERTIIDSIRSGACSVTHSDVPDDNLEDLCNSLNHFTPSFERAPGEPRILATKSDLGVVQTIIRAICEEIQIRKTGGLE